MSKNNLDKLFETLRGITRPDKERADSENKTTLTGETFLIAGLGNPGREYEDTRHNIGFMTVTKLAERLGLVFTRTQSKALVTDGRYQGNRLILAKPQTFMNASGNAVSALVKFYKIPLENLFVVYDDVDLPYETIRIKPSGGSAGHRGMNSIIERLGTQEFPRIRLGVGRPQGHKQAADYVLKSFSKQETEFLDAYLDRAVDAIFSILQDGIEAAMTHYNRNNE